MYDDIEKTTLLYHSYLSDYELELLERILNNHLICIILGRDSNVDIDATSKDGNGYFLYKIKLSELIDSTKNAHISLSKMSKGNNALLADYVQLLTQISEYLEKKLPEFDTRFVINKFVPGNRTKY